EYGDAKDLHDFLSKISGNGPVVYFQWPPCSLHVEPVLLHLLQVSLPNIPLARPPLQEGQSWTGR
ncbi:MAG: hypothetical protein WBB62_11675, partial [Rhodococcus sp. (in: high G+C Gram-positive bacteria)]